MPKPIDLTGREFGYLKVVRFAGISDKKVRKWECKCKCGNIIYVRVADLTSGNTKSCGCLQKEIARKNKTKHGCCKERLYRIWCNMKTRCTNPKTAQYKDYGGRGISICKDWMYSYQSFREWALENGYRDDLTLERIDVNGNYCPENCTFIPKSKQPLNSRSNHFVCYNGEIKTLTEWSRILKFATGTYRKHRKEFETDEETINYILSKHKEAYYGK